MVLNKWILSLLSNEYPKYLIQKRNKKITKYNNK